MIDQSERVNDIISKILLDKIEDDNEFDFNYLQEKELEYLGFNITYNLFNNVEKYYTKYNAGPLNGNKNRSVIVFDRIKEITTKNNELMFLGSIKDNNFKSDFVIFPKTLKNVKCKLEYGKLYLIEFKIKVEDNKKQYIIERIGVIE
jgi:DNA polymerase III alpha subunit